MKQGIILSLLCIFNHAYAQENTLSFPHACDQGQKIVIAVMGDLLFHQPLQKKASGQGFESLWTEALPFIKAADVAYANLEGPIAFGDKDPVKWDFNVYTDFPRLNYHPRLAKDLKSSGFTLVSTANNHAFDRHAIGIDKTLDILDQVGVGHVGSRKRSSKESLVKMLEVKGIKIAWIACTEHTNGQKDDYHQVLFCSKPSDRQWMLKKIQTLKQQVDAIIISPHWGEEYHEQASRKQIDFATQLLNAGATLVLGSHPHVLQPIEKIKTEDGRSTLVSYSLGNFVSYQGSNRTRSTVILLVGLTKTSEGTIINGIRFVPMYMVNRNGVENIHLMKLTPENRSWTSFQHILKYFPIEKALFSPPLITNPECQ